MQKQSERANVWAVGAAVGVVLLAFVVGWGRGTASSPHRTSGAAARPLVRPATGAGRGAPVGHLLAAGDPGTAACRAAASFAVAFWSWDWRTPDRVAAARLEARLTPDLAAGVATSPGAAAFDAGRVADREIDVVGAVATTIEDRSPAGIAVAVSAVVTVERQGSAPASGRQDAEVLMVDGRTGWRVARIDL